MTIKINTGIDITTASIKRVLYVDRKGYSGYWNITEIEGTSFMVLDTEAQNIEPGIYRIRADVDGHLGSVVDVKVT